MAMAIIRKKCSKSTCEVEKGTCDCNGCATTYCPHHYQEHREALGTLRHEIECDYNVLKQTLHDKKNAPISDINQWVQQSMDAIKQIAEQYQRKFIEYRNRSISDIENQLQRLDLTLRQISKENSLDETELNQTKEIIHTLRDELNTVLDISTEPESTPSTITFSLRVPFHNGDITIKSIFQRLCFLSSIDPTKPLISLQAIIPNIEEKGNLLNSHDVPLILMELMI